MHSGQPFACLKGSPASCTAGDGPDSCSPAGTTLLGKPLPSPASIHHMDDIARAIRDTIASDAHHLNI